MQPCLLVWGRIVDGQPVLEPAFQIVTRPSLPRASGPVPHRGRAADGSSVFRVSFAPTQVADDPAAEAQFAFAVPLQPDRAERLVARWTSRSAGVHRERPGVGRRGSNRGSA